MSKGNQRPRFEEIQRGDPGRDGGGIYRNIARETRIPNILTKGKYSTLEWAEICKLFTSKPTDERVQVCLVDTVVINRGDVEMYLYTNSDGYIARKPSQMHAMQKIRDEFCSFIDLIQPHKHLYVAIAHYTAGSPVPLDLENFNSICMGSTPLDLELLQVFIPSKGNLSSSATYKTDYWLDRYARPILKTIRIGVKEEISGSKNRETTPSMNRRLNLMMESYCRHVVNCIQESFQCSVVRLSLEFVEDSQGKIWLMRSTECLHAIEKITASRSISPENLKMARTSLVTSGAGDSSQGYRPSSSTGNGNGSIPRSAHTVGAGHFSEERIQKRKLENEKFYPPEEAVRSILSGLPSSADGPRPRSKLSPVRVLERNVKLREHGGHTELIGSLPPPPTATLNFVNTPLHPNTTSSGSGSGSSKFNTAVLGSSQLEGCPGDFCQFDLSFLENKDLANGAAGGVGGSDYSRSDLSDFRRRLLLGSIANEDETDDMSLQALGAFKSSSAAHSIPSGVSSTSGAGAVAAAGSSSRAIGSTTGQAFKKIPYRIIIQTRQEMPLVNRLLRRIRRGDDGRSSSLSSEQRKQLSLYVTEDTYGDLAVSGKLPSHYYQDVTCCDVCYQIYKLITEARATAIQHIEQKKIKKNQKEKKKFHGDTLQLQQTQHHRQTQQQTGGQFPLNRSVDLTSTSIDEDSSFHTQVYEAEAETETDIGGGSYSALSLSPSASASRHRSTTTQPPPRQSLSHGFESEDYEIQKNQSLRAALLAIESLTKTDIAEIKTMSKPPAAVEVVMEAVLILLTGKIFSFQECRKLLSGGATSVGISGGTSGGTSASDSFLLMLKQFQLEDVTDARLRMIEPYVDNPVFRPENVIPISACAAKFCGWVLGVVQAARWQRGLGHKRSDYLQLSGATAGGGGGGAGGGGGGRAQQQRSVHGQGQGQGGQSLDETGMTFMQKLERKKANTRQQQLLSTSASTSASASASVSKRKGGRGGGKGGLSVVSKEEGIGSATTLFTEFNKKTIPSQNYISRSLENYSSSQQLTANTATPHTATPHTATATNTKIKIKNKEILRREQIALLASQKKSSERLSSHNKSEGNLSTAGISKSFRCFDGITKMSYIVLGSVSLDITRCNFIVIHDFFDTCDATAIAFKPLIQRHSQGCQVLCFNYPGQANTVWPRPTAVERQRGAGVGTGGGAGGAGGGRGGGGGGGGGEQLINNEWIADRLHELLQHAEEDGDILLTNPFHLIGIGNGTSIASAFALKYGNDSLYSSSLRSLVSINGFLSPDPQLSAILHSAAQIFESTPHNRPDIPVSYWARFVFSEEYLSKINPNLALNIYTAVSNPITNEGRAKIARGCLKHKDLRGYLHPDHLPDATTARTSAPRGAYGATHRRRGRQEEEESEEEDDQSVASSNSSSDSSKLHPLHVPVILLQSTEDLLVNASNVDPFLIGRQTKHLWSHQQNVLSSDLLLSASDTHSSVPWVGKLSNSSADYAKFSLLGKAGLGMLLESLDNPRGAFVMWTRAGHAVYQENKTALLDLMDALAYPSAEYYGINKTVPSSASAFGRQQQQGGLSGVIERETALPAKGKSKAKGKDKGSKTKRISSEEEESDKEEQDEEPLSIGPEASVGSSSPREDGAGHAEGEGDEDEDEMVLFKIVTPRAPAAAPAEREEEEEEEEEETKEDNADAEDPAAALSPQETQEAEAEATEEEAYVLEESKVSPLSSRHPSPRTIELSVLSGNRETVSKIDDSSVTSSSPVLKNPTPMASLRTEVTETEAETTDPTPASTTAAPAAAPVSVAPAPVAPAAPVAPVAVTKSRNIQSEPLVMQPAPSHPQLPQKSAHLGSSTSTSAAPPAASPSSASAPKPLPSPETLHRSLDEKLTTLSAKNQQIASVAQESDVQRLERLSREQEARRAQFKEEDDELLRQLEKELEGRRREREKSERMRLLEIQQIEDQLVKSGLVPEYVPRSTTEPVRVRELPDMKYDSPADLPVAFTESRDVVTALDRMLVDEEHVKKMTAAAAAGGAGGGTGGGGKGGMTLEKYEEVKAQMLLTQINQAQKVRHMEAEEQQRYVEDCGKFIQRVIRGHLGRMRAYRAAQDRLLQKKIQKGITILQSRVRGGQDRRRVMLKKKLYLANLMRGDSVVTMQRVIRGFMGRKFYRKKRRFHAARNIQRVFRGHVGRVAACRERERLGLLKRKMIAATKIQSIWKMKVAKEEFRSLRIHLLAAVEIQRMYRGYLGRKTMLRRREWETATPGPQRIQLGLRLIEESKVAFERQQEEIDALHRAQERAEARVSHIHSELKESEKELVVLERELQEIDQIERDLAVMTHERDVLAKNIQDAAGMPRTALPGHEGAVMGREPGIGQGGGGGGGGGGGAGGGGGDEIRRKKAEAYALELTIQIKRAEREKKRQELETEFASVFQEVEKKRKALERLEASLADMESTRERKDREFRRLQKNLMQLLMEQKQELDDLREKGIELETATATTAAAAVATAKKAKEHEKHSTAMFSQTEELMKFQFMSMSLSYFSSLNMLKQLRDMNSDTTAAAVSSSADAAAAAAAAATAANLPNMKKLHLGAEDFVSLNIQKKRAELAAAENAEKEVRNAKATPLPANILMWGVDDVSRWMESLSLGQYCAAFREATVDGPFLMELREEDLIQVLGVTHKLHVRKIIVSREKLKPLSKQEIIQKEVVEHEETADRRRNQIGVPDIETVFSQARNGRLKRLEESLNLGFNVDTEDTKGNTLLLVASQNSNRKMVEMLVARGASINHQNAQGNTALHFAMSFDVEGLIAEYLIQNGADDTVENVDGLTPYDGVK